MVLSAVFPPWGSCSHRCVLATSNQRSALMPANHSTFNLQSPRMFSFQAGTYFPVFFLLFFWIVKSHCTSVDWWWLSPCQHHPTSPQTQTPDTSPVIHVFSPGLYTLAMCIQHAPINRCLFHMNVGKFDIWWNLYSCMTPRIYLVN